MKLPFAMGVSAVVLACGLTAGAATIVPGDAELFDGGFSSLSREADRALQQFIDSSYLTAITEPVNITAMSFRLPAVATVDYPETADLTFNRYEVSLGAPSAASAAANALASNTFADNMQDVTVVRSGSMTIPFGSMSADELAPAAGFTYVINFSTPYLYNPGEDIVIMVRHNGHGDTVVTKWNFDSFGYTGGTKVTTGTGNIDATTAALSFDTVNKYQFTYDVVPEPASLGVLAMGSLLLVRRRR